MFPTDPTSDEVNAELKRVREQAEMHEEIARRRAWDDEHGYRPEYSSRATADDTVEGEAEEVQEQIDG